MTWSGLTPEHYNVDGLVLVILFLYVIIIININFNILTWSGITPEHYSVDGLFVSFLIPILLNNNIINHHHYDYLQHLHYNSNRGGSHLITSMLFEGNAIKNVHIFFGILPHHISIDYHYHVANNRAPK